MRLGKTDFVEDDRDLKFAQYRSTVSLPLHPDGFGHEDSVQSWPMLANDEYGDCVWASAAHETQLWYAERTGTDGLIFDDTNVLAAYAAVTGFDPDDPTTDNGTDVREALKWRRRAGLCDESGRWHRINSYVQIARGHWEHTLDALYLFGAVEIGFQLPSTAMDQFNSGETWDVIPGGPIEGGHCVPVVAYRNGLLYCVSWGKLQPMTQDFFETYTDEIWAILDDEMLALGKSPEGFSYSQLRADLALVK